MKTFTAFSATGNWFKGNCHTHTTVSDGTRPPRAIVAAYEKLGHHFLVLTDHRLIQPDADLSTDRILVIGGIELHPPSRKPACGPHHLLGLGIHTQPPIEKLEKADARATIRWIERNGGIPVYCHPYWSGHDLDHLQEGRACIGVEVYNSVCEITRGLGDSSAHYDHALSAGMRWSAFATDDTHRSERDAGGGWIVVKAKTCTEKAILTAIRKGRFYASCGPEIHSLSIKRNVLRVECSPVRKITWHGQGPSGTTVRASRKLLTSDERPLTKAMRKSKYLRLEITDSTGRKAWSNPIYRDAKTGRWSDG